VSCRPRHPASSAGYRPLGSSVRFHVLWLSSTRPRPLRFA
jgi:hypothetical protein